MNYHIKNENWKQIFDIVTKFKGLHRRDEKRFKRFMDALLQQAVI